MAAFYRARVRSGDGLRLNFNWSHSRVRRDQRLTRKGSNLINTDPRSAGHGGFFSAELRIEERGIWGLRGFSSGLESSA
jgi:hypothetical protein